TTTTSPPPPPSNNCTSTLAAGSTGAQLVAWFNALSSGAVGCVHSGSYGNSSDGFDLTKSGTASAPITLQSVPGDKSTLSGWWALDGSYITVKNVKFDESTNQRGASCDSSGIARPQSFTIAGSNDLIDHNEFTASTQSLSSNGMYVTGSNTEVRFNKIHDL